MPPRIAPSPAAEEPGQQNAVARLRSSREAQSRLLAERRGEAAVSDDEIGRSDPSSTVVQAGAAGDPGKREGNAVRSAPVKATVGHAATGKKPPANPSNPEVDVREAVLWAILSGAVITAVKILLTRRAANYYAKSTGQLPPGLTSSN